MTRKNPISLHLKADDFLPATESEKEDLVQMRPGVSFWRESLRRLLRSRVAKRYFPIFWAPTAWAAITPCV